MDGVAEIRGEENGATKTRLKPLPSPRHPLLPIVPQHGPPTGALGVDKEDTRVVYLAPLMTTSKEMYFAKHKELLKGKCNTEGNNEEQEREQRTKTSLERHLAVIRRPTQPQTQQPISSVFAVPSMDDLQRSNNAPTPSTVEPGAVGSTDGQLKRMKQRVKLLPISDEDSTSFWETIRGYEKMRAYYHQTVLAGGASTPMGFNTEAAFKRMLLVERHLVWVHTHASRLEGNKMRKVQEDEIHERRVIETSSDYRAQQRLHKRIREQLASEAQNMQPIVMLGAFTQKMLNVLRMHWSRCRLESSLSRTVRIWRRHRSVKRTNSQAAYLLVDWLQKSVAVKSVSFRVFRGLRMFVRRVKRVQGLWRKKQAVRRRRMLIVEKAWMELETQYVDAAIEECENMRLETDHNKSPKSGSKQKQNKKRELWMRFVPDPVRAQVISEFLHKVEREYREKFRHQEEDFFPQLVQTLRGEHPNRARSYIRAVASRHALCGKVVHTLLQYPGAVGDDVVAVRPFDVHQAPLSELILEGRDRCNTLPNSRSTVRPR